MNKYVFDREQVDKFRIMVNDIPVKIYQLTVIVTKTEMRFEALPLFELPKGARTVKVTALGEVKEYKKEEEK